MNQVFYLHFDEVELKERIKPLIAAGFDVRYHFSTLETVKWIDYNPDVMVISLDRLPSHGRTYADGITASKKWKDSPIVFVGGKPDKVEPIKAKFPQGVFCSNEALTDTIRQIAGKK